MMFNNKNFAIWICKIHYRRFFVSIVTAVENFSHRVNGEWIDTPNAMSCRGRQLHESLQTKIINYKIDIVRNNQHFVSQKAIYLFCVSTIQYRTIF